MKKLFITVFSFLLLANSLLLHAQINPALSNALQKALDSARVKYNITGVSAAIAMPNKEVWTGVSGMSDPTSGRKINAGMHFGIGSVTKTFITAIILQLASENKLLLEDPLYKYLPRFSNIDSFITIRQLLSHTSGIYNYTNNYQLWSQMIYGGNKIWKPEELLLYVLSPSFPAGSRYEYSNTNFILLGMIIKKVTGSQLSNELHSRLLNPLGLKNIFLEVEDTIKGEVSDCWSDYNYDGTMENVMLLNITSLYSGAWAAGGIFSDAADLARWAQLLYGGEVLTREYMEQMLAFTRLSNGSYGLGTGRYMFAGREMWGHGGSIPGFRTLCCYSKKDNIGVAVMINQDNRNPDNIGSALIETIVNFIPSALGRTSEEKLSLFYLGQNYPNPFNPVTRIKYSIPKSCNVKLAVFDLLGNEVNVIVNEYKSIGTYTTDFNAATLSSGFYLYCLSAGEYRDVKKLVLIK